VHKFRFLLQEIITPQDIPDHVIIHRIKLCKNRYHTLSTTIPLESVAYFTLCHFKLQSFLLSTSGPPVLKFLKSKKRGSKISLKPTPIAVQHLSVSISKNKSYIASLQTIHPPDAYHPKAYTETGLPEYLTDDRSAY
jgi:hypothetical protein